MTIAKLGAQRARTGENETKRKRRKRERKREVIISEKS